MTGQYIERKFSHTRYVHRWLGDKVSKVDEPVIRGESSILKVVLWADLHMAPLCCPIYLLGQIHLYEDLCRLVESMLRVLR